MAEGEVCTTCRQRIEEEGATEDAAQKENTTMPRTITQVRSELDALEATARRYSAGLNEGGDGYNPHHAQLIALRAELDALESAAVDAAYAAQVAAEDAEWAREVTMERRAAWNAWVKSQSATIHPAQMAAHCKEVGYDMVLLRRQIMRHGL